MLLAHTLTVLGLVALAATSATAVEVAPEVVATWRGGVLERADYESWLRFSRREDTPEARTEMVLALSLAAAGAAGGCATDHLGLEIEALRHRVLTAALKERVTAQVSVDDDEVEALRRLHPDAFERPRKLRLHNIYKRLGDGPERAETLARMAELQRRLLAGADFAELARAESESESRFRGGDLGLVDPSQLDPAVARAVGELAAGELSRPVIHGGGVTIFRCDEMHGAVTPSADELRATLRAKLLRERRSERWQALVEELRSTARVRITQRPDGPAVVIGETELSGQALASLVALRRPGRSLAELPPAELEELLESWADGVVLARHAVATGVAEEAEVAAALRWQELTVTARCELRRRVESRLEPPSEDALRAWFDGHRQSYRQYARYELAVIRFTPEGRPLDGATVALADDVVRRLGRGELDFAEAARRHSSHASAPAGGVIGWLEARQVAALDISLLKAVRALRPGELTGLLTLPSGLWLVELRARQEPRPSTFEEALPRLRAELRQAAVATLEHDVRQEQLAAIGCRVGDGGSVALPSDAE